MGRRCRMLRPVHNEFPSDFPRETRAIQRSLGALLARAGPPFGGERPADQAVEGRHRARLDAPFLPDAVR